jgi:hypothetical protein
MRTKACLDLNLNYETRKTKTKTKHVQTEIQQDFIGKRK